MALAIGLTASPPLAIADGTACQGMIVLPVRLHVAYPACPHAPVDAWIDAQVDEANRLLACALVQFRVVARDQLVGRDAGIEDRAAFEAAGERADDGSAVDVFVVASLLRGLGDPEGVGVPPRLFEHSGFVAVVRTEYPQLLAHELGHFLGLHHSGDPSNFMASTGRGARITIQQCRALRATVRAPAPPRPRP